MPPTEPADSIRRPEITTFPAEERGHENAFEQKLDDKTIN
jgi:hypothetical protein